MLVEKHNEGLTLSEASDMLGATFIFSECGGKWRFYTIQPLQYLMPNVGWTDFEEIKDCTSLKECRTKVARSLNGKLCRSLRPTTKWYQLVRKWTYVSFETALHVRCE